ncbi:MAG: M23 family metallopeptidase [Actinomycetaceae bacterium]|nr:M23 family metallopeptidase [Actinomycetaceae bacterium]
MKLKQVLLIALGYLLGLVGAGTSLSLDYANPVVTSWSVSGSPWLLPTPPPLKVGRAFAPPAHDWLSGHRGVDLCPGVGAEIRAPTAGTVIYAGRLNDRDLVSIQLANGLRTSFEPLQVQVTKGQFVQAGEVLGRLVPGHDGDCLHWGVRTPAGNYLNPLRFILGRPRLLPWSEPVRQTAK